MSYINSKMYSTINDSAQQTFICTCGCKTYNLKLRRKSIRHRAMQRKEDMKHIKAIDENDDIILNDFPKYNPLIIKKKSYSTKKIKEKHYQIINCLIDFD